MRGFSNQWRQMRKSSWNHLNGVKRSKRSISARVVAIFLFGIVPARQQVDEWLWVVVGDLPSAYLVTDDCKVPSEALQGYITEMRKWVRLAKAGRTSPNVIPVNVPATPEWAKELEGRLNFLEKDILPRFRDDEVQRA
jgi:hypothetical protein